MQTIKIPVELIHNPNLTPSDVIVYGVLLEYSYRDINNKPISILTNGEIADATNFNEKTISKSLKRLKENNLIKVQRGLCLFANQAVRRKIYPQMF